VEVYEDGWALIDTGAEGLWVYLNGNFRYIDRTMGIFDNKGDENKAAILSPQLVSVIEQDQNWLLIDTWRGATWIDLDYTPPRNALENIMKQYNNTVSVYYENLETGFVYRYNADKIYNTASVIKAPYCLYIYNLAENGQTDLTSRHIYTGSYYNSGSGIIKNMKTGSAFTENELLALTIRESDNIATKMLIDKYGVDGFKEFASGIGGNPDLINRILFSNSNSRMNPDEAALYMKAIYDYIEGDHIYSSQFKTDLLNASFTAIVTAINNTRFKIIIFLLCNLFIFYQNITVLSELF
jgi:beta-lactamase class A